MTDRIRGMDRPRVRFAPSPTGYLHVGGARTALFNWLFARRHGGTFILRIEDTDTERSSDEMVAGILESMRWLGLDWDEGPGIGGPHAPYFQTQRFERHKAVAHQLLAGGSAYKCYCSPELLKEKRDAAEKAGGGWKYDRTCLHLSAEEQQRLEASGVQPAMRFKVPAGKTSYTDHVRGHIEVDHEQIEDFVILRSNGLPIYHLSVVADDIDMGITHVIRGDDHISNTPKHILLWQALGQDAAGVRARAADSRHRQEEAEQAARHDVGDRVRAPRISARCDGEFSRAARMVARRRSRGDVARRADCGVLARGHQRRRRGVRSGEARLVQRAVSRAVEPGRSRART